MNHDANTGAGGKSQPTGRLTFFFNVFLVILVMVIWGFSYVIIRLTVRDGIIPPFTLAFLRFLLALAVLYMVPNGGNGKAKHPPGRRDVTTMYLMGVFGVFLYFTFENFGLIHTTATNASIIVSLAPVFTLIGASLFFGLRPGPINWAGTALAFLGSAFVVWNGQVNFDLNPLGDLMIVLSAAAWAAYTLVGKKIVEKYDALLVSRKMIFAGVICLLPFSAWEFSAGRATAITPVSLLGVIFLGVFCSALAFIVWNRTMAALGIVFVSNMIYLQCAITMIIAWATIREPVTPMLLGGTATVIAGVYLANMNNPVRTATSSRKYSGV